MHLLKRSQGGAYQLETFQNSPPPYAILSHTWHDPSEITHDDILTGSGKDKGGYAKLDFCSKRAAQDGLAYVWIDTCCINKRSETELSQAINSMFRWYRDAAKCYVYLSDVVLPKDDSDLQCFHEEWKVRFRASRWFTRGWTLQELLAPRVVEFYSQEGRMLGTKTSLEKDLYEVTSVPINALRGFPLNMFRIEDRFKWSTGRKTTIREDQVYCLLGIFEIFMPLIYGEGEEHAKSRLLKELPQNETEPHLRAAHQASSKPVPNDRRCVTAFLLSTSTSLGLIRPVHSTKSLSYEFCKPQLAIPSEDIKLRISQIHKPNQLRIITFIVTNCKNAAYAFYYNNELWRIKAGPSAKDAKLFAIDRHDYVRRPEDLNLREWICRTQRAVLDGGLYGHLEERVLMLQDYEYQGEYRFANAQAILNMIGPNGSISPLDLESSISHAISWCRSLKVDACESWLSRLWVILHAHINTDWIIDMWELLQDFSDS